MEGLPAIIQWHWLWHLRGKVGNEESKVFFVWSRPSSFTVDFKKVVVQALLSSSHSLSIVSIAHSTSNVLIMPFLYNFIILGRGVGGTEDSKGLKCHIYSPTIEKEQKQCQIIWEIIRLTTSKRYNVGIHCWHTNVGIHCGQQTMIELTWKKLGRISYVRSLLTSRMALLHLLLPLPILNLLSSPSLF